MSRSLVSMHKSASGRRGLFLPLCLLAALFLAITACFASEEPLPKISANENRVPAGRLESGVLTVHLELRKGVWHPEAEGSEEQDPGAFTPNAIETYSFAEQGHNPVMPGPLLRVPQGTELRVSVHNRLPVAVFVHGLATHPGDGKGVLQLAPNETKEARFAPGEPGTYLYWANTSLQGRGEDGPMSGAFVVDAPGAPTDDRIFVIQVWAKDLYHQDFHAALTLNGKSWPYTERLHAAIGEPEHWRIVNATPFGHPMHLHGFYFDVNAVGDGQTEHLLSPAERRKVVTEFVDGHHTFDMTWVPERVGNWVFHCHIVDHMGKELSPTLFGPEGPPPTSAHVHHGSEQHSGMSSLVMGITVSDARTARLVPAKAVIEPDAVERQLYIRERPAQPYVPAGPGFFLQGVSQEVGAIGPPLVIMRGQRTAIKVFNELNEPTAIHWHGLEIESYYDGVPGWDGNNQRTTPAIAPGGSFTAYMTPPRAGTFIYHTHWHDMAQLTGGMYGALLVLEPGEKYDPATDKVFVLGRSGINEMHCPMVLNGNPQPGLMVLLAGQTYRFRLVNITPNDAQVATSLMVENHPAKWRALAKDGADLPSQQATVRDAVVTLSVGETYDFEFTPKAPGDFQLQFASDLGNTVTQAIAVVPPGSPFSVFAANK